MRYLPLILLGLFFNSTIFAGRVHYGHALEKKQINKLEKPSVRRIKKPKKTDQSERQQITYQNESLNSEVTAIAALIIAQRNMDAPRK